MSETHQPTDPEPADSSTSKDALRARPPVVPPEGVDLHPREWFRRFFAANPFYLASVVLLLYGIHRVSSDTGFLRIEVQQLFFNFSAIQLYEVALVGIAVFLARRSVWYDCTLLVIIENLVIIVPFILVTQASLIDQSWIWGFCLAGLGMVIARVTALKQFLRELNLPSRVLKFGAALLMVNAILPMVYRELQEERVARTITWGPAYHVNEWSWLALLPILLACVNLLSRARSVGPLLPQRAWLPVAIIGSWLVATGVHLYALSYVYTFEMRATLWAPLLVVIAWTLQHRLADLLPRSGPALRIGLLFGPLPCAFVPLGSKDADIALALLVLNALLYAWTAVRGEYRRLAGQLAVVSVVGVMACVPAVCSAPPPAGGPEAFRLTEALLGYVFVASLISRRPGLGLLGAVVTGAGLAMLLGPVMTGACIPVAVHGALMFLLLHSLHWVCPEQVAARALRWVAAVLWAIHALLWIANGGPVWLATVTGFGALILWWLVLWMRGMRPPMAIALGATVVAFSGPILSAGGWVVDAPAGLLAVLSSFLLLVLGTAGALTKHRWRPIPGH